MKKTRGLGRGLDALLGGDEPETASGTLQMVAIDRLMPGKYQPRTRMDAESLEALSQSIQAQGLMQPILVRSLPDDRLEIIAGERRWRAAGMAGLAEVPVLVRQVADESALAMALIENIQRENLNPLEEAAGIQRLIDEFGMTHQDAAHSVGRSRSAVSNLLRLLGLPAAVQALMMDGQLDMGHGRALLALPESSRESAAHQVVERNLSVRETERWVARLLGEPQAQHKPPAPVDRDVADLAERLSDRLGAQVSIRGGRNGSGKLVIEYANLDQLDQIINRL